MTGAGKRRALFGFLGAMLVAIAANAAIVRVKDPLLFWADKATAEQPFFSTPEQGNFSRYVFSGLMRRLSYDTLWLGPSYATPFGSTQDTQNELMVSMGNMTALEMVDLLAFEATLGKASTINLVVSPLHFTSYYFKIVRSTATFPERYYGSFAGLPYLLDPQMSRLALARVNGARDKDFLADDARVGINRRYFWMADNADQMKTYWKRYSMAGSLKSQLATLRRNLPQVPTALSAQRDVDNESKEALRSLFSQIEALPGNVQVNLILPPAHLGYWAHPAPLVAEALNARNAVIEFAAKHDRVKLFDFEADWDTASDRSYFYDAGHFSDRHIQELRAAVQSGRERVGDMQAIFDRFLATSPEFDAAQIAVVTPDA